MACQAFSTKTPSNILRRADQIWNSKQNKYNYGGSYKSPDPSTYYTQMFGREVCFANGAAGLTALDLLYENNKGGPQPTHPNNTHNTTVSATSNSQRWCSQSTNEVRVIPSLESNRQLYHVDDVRSCPSAGKRGAPSIFCSRCHHFSNFTCSVYA